MRLEPIRFVKLDSEHAQSERKSVNRGPVLNPARGRDSSGDENGPSQKRLGIRRGWGRSREIF